MGSIFYLESITNELNI